MEGLLRRYRYLVLCSPLLEVAGGHAAVIAGLAEPHRAEVLQLVRRELLVGLRVSPADAPALARYLVAAERRRPGALAALLPPPVLEALVAGLERTTSDEVLAAYADWTPPPERASALDSVHHRRSRWERLEDDAVYQFMMDSQLAPASQPPKVRR